MFACFRLFQLADLADEYLAPSAAGSRKRKAAQTKNTTAAAEAKKKKKTAIPEGAVVHEVVDDENTAIVIPKARLVGKPLLLLFLCSAICCNGVFINDFFLTGPSVQATSCWLLAGALNPLQLPLQAHRLPVLLRLPPWRLPRAYLSM